MAKASILDQEGDKESGIGLVQGSSKSPYTLEISSQNTSKTYIALLIDCTHGKKV
jgi:hypothetical protein